jgi:hypothetical protein
LISYRFEVLNCHFILSFSQHYVAGTVAEIPESM